MKMQNKDSEIRFDSKEISTIYFDMDGTIIDPRSLRVTESTAKAFKALQKQGIRIALCTTRNYPDAVKAPGMENIEWDGYVLESGNLVMDKEKKTVTQRSYDPEDLRMLFERAAMKNIPVFFNNGTEYVTIANELTAHIDEKYGMGNTPLGSWHGESVCMLTLVSDDEEKIRELLEPIPGIVYRRGGDVNYDLALRGVTKLTGIQALQKYWNLEDAAFGAFGDTEADAYMLSAAKAGFAMPWADEKASAAATVKCKDYGPETIEKALQETGLI